MDEQVLAERVAKDYLAKRGLLATRHMKDALKSLGFLDRYFDMQIEEVLSDNVADRSIALGVQKLVREAVGGLEAAVSNWDKVFGNRRD